MARMRFAAPTVAGPCALSRRSLRGKVSDSAELLQEGRELAGHFGAAVLRLDEAVREGRPTGPPCGDAFRAVHTLKSIAAFAAMPEVAQVARTTEDALGRVREGRIALGDALFGLLLAAEALLLVGLEQSGSAAHQGRVEAWSEAMGELLDSPSDRPPTPAIEPSIAREIAAMLSAAETEALRNALAREGSAWLWEHAYDLLNLDTELEAARTRLAPYAEWIALLPGRLDTSPMELGLCALLVSTHPVSALAAALGAPTSEFRTATEAPAAPLAAAKAWRSEVVLEPASPTVRVQIEVLDTMLAELAALTRNGANRAARAQHIGALRDALVHARSVELSQLYERLARATRQASLELGKPVRLTTHGGELQLDKRLSDNVFEPLLHAVRNALDHGIESPAVRLARGKEETGRLVVTAYNRAGGVAIDVEDDGDGIYLPALRQRAAEAGVVSVATARSASDEECLSWAFLPGLSTRRDVGEHSGRGVGLDAVRTAIRAVGGQVELRSVAGVGTKLSLFLPRHASIMRTAQVRSGDLQIDIPLVHLRAAESVAGHTERVVAGERLLQRGAERFFALSLGRLLGERVPASSSPEDTVLHLQRGGRVSALLVPSPVRVGDVLLHPMGPVFEKLHTYLGVAEHADGSLALVVDDRIDAPSPAGRHPTEASASWEPSDPLSGPMLCIRRGALRASLPARWVREVSSARGLLRVPEAPAPVFGVVLRQGHVVPVLDSACATGSNGDAEAPTWLIHLQGAFDGVVVGCDHAHCELDPQMHEAHVALPIATWAQALGLVRA